MGFLSFLTWFAGAAAAAFGFFLSLSLGLSGLVFARFRTRDS